MGKLLINSNGLKTHFSPVLDDGITDLVNAINLAESLDIPSGFSYRSYLKSLPDTLKKSHDTCIIIKDFVTNSIINFNNASLEVCDLFNNIEVINIKNRNTIIK